MMIEPSFLLWAFGAFFVLWFIIRLLPISESDEPALIRPALTDEELKLWTELYQANAIRWRGYFVSVEGKTWEMWAELTGKEEWLEAPGVESPSPLPSEHSASRKLTTEEDGSDEQQD